VVTGNASVAIWFGGTISILAAAFAVAIIVMLSLR
jgi:hypothetical protein